MISTTSANLKVTYILSAVIFSISGCKVEYQPLNSSKYKDWSVYLGDKMSTQYSSLEQVNVHNVHKLEVAWEFSTGDLRDGVTSAMQSNPIVVDGVLYATTASLKAFALKA